MGRTEWSTSVLDAVREEIWAQHLVVTHQAKQPMPDGWGITRAEAILALVAAEYTLIPKHVDEGARVLQEYLDFEEDA